MGVKCVLKSVFSECLTPMETVSGRCYELIGGDRDKVEKGKKAFVSYVRAYKEHDLRFIFEFKNVDIGQVANSFFLFRIPRVKEILGKNIQSFEQHEIEIDSIPWLDKNQEIQFRLKQEQRDQLREQREGQARTVQDIKNIKSKRKKMKRKNQERELQELNSLHRQILKDKRGQSTAARAPEEGQEDDSD